MLASQQVINAIVARLVAAATGSQDRVHSDRFHPVAAYPTTKVVHVDEDLAAEADDVTWPAQRLHTLDVDVVILVQATSGLDAAMSAAALQVLQALEGSIAAATLAPLVGCQVQATGLRYEAQGEGAAITGKATVRLRVLFHTQTNNPETLI